MQLILLDKQSIRGNDTLKIPRIKRSAVLIKLQLVGGVSTHDPI